MRNIRLVLSLLIAAVVVVGLAFYAFVSSLPAGPSKVVRVNRENPELEAAIKRAQSELDDFMKELASPKTGESFAVKGRFSTAAGPEYLWVRKPVFRDGRISGILDQQPMALRGAKKGDAVQLPKNNVVDWLIKDDKGIRGAYTEKVLSRG